MATSPESSARRDRATRFSSGMRAGVVAVGVLGSLGVAGFLASSVPQNHQVAAPAVTQVTTWSGEDDGPAQGQHTVTLQPGTASGTHATTGGSTHVSSTGGQSSSVTGTGGLLPGSGAVHATSGGS